VSKDDIDRWFFVIHHFRKFHDYSHGRDKQAGFFAFSQFVAGELLPSLSVLQPFSGFGKSVLVTGVGCPIRAHLSHVGGEHLGIVLKIETRQALERLPYLLLAAMRSSAAGVMIARGDLA
jgi:hypothetical protein